MSMEENRAVIRRYCEEVVNKGNVALVDELWDANVINHGLAPGILPGAAYIKVLVQRFHAAFPDLHFTIEDMIAEGEKVVIRLTVRGTHKGEFLGIAATGKQVTTTTIAIYKFASGRIVEVWGIRDDRGVLQQMGAIPPIG